MNRLGSFAFLSLAIAATGCKKSATDGSSQAARDTAAPVEAGTNPAMDPGKCDLSTAEKALEWFHAVATNDDRSSVTCAELLPGIEGAYVGDVAFDIGCDMTHILYQCRVFPLRDGLSPLLAAMGWTTGNAAERERIAMLWLRAVEFAGTLIAGGKILDAELPGFAGSGRTFEPPKAESLPEGGVRVTLWVLYEGGMGPPSAHHLEYSFSADGEMESEVLERFHP